MDHHTKSFLRVKALKILIFSILCYCTILMVFQVNSSPGGQSAPLTKPQIDGLFAALEDPYPYVRLRAFDQLHEADADLIEQKHLFEIAGLLKNSEWKVRKHAVEVLGKTGSMASPHIGQIQNLLNDEEKEVRWSAANALGKLGPLAHGSIPELIICLTDNEREVRWSAANALGMVAPVSSKQLAEIILLLKDSEGKIRWAAAHALGEAGTTSREHIPVIAALLNRQDHDIQRCAITAVGIIGDGAKTHIKKLSFFLSNDNSDIRRDAVHALGKMESSASAYFSSILPLLSDDDRKVRWAAARALAKIGSGSAAHGSKVAALLKHDSYDIRRCAVYVLGEMGAAARDHISQIAVFLNAQEKEMRRSAAEALGKIGRAAKSQIPQIARYLKDKNEHVRWAAAYCLGEIGLDAKDHIPDIASLLHDKSYHVRKTAAYTLGNMGAAVGGHYVSDVAALLNDDKNSVRKFGVYALAKMSPTANEYIPKIADLLTNSNADTRKSAAYALGELGSASKDYIPEIATLLEDSDSEVRWAAIYALKKMGLHAKELAPQMALLIRDNETIVQSTAIAALTELGDLDLNMLIHILSSAYPIDSEITPKVRFAAHSCGGGTPEASIALKWLGLPAKLKPSKIDTDSARAALTLFQKIWPQSSGDLRKELEKNITDVICKKGIRWKPFDADRLTAMNKCLRAVGSTNTAAVEKTINTLQRKSISYKILIVLAVHFLFWMTLIFFYPRSRNIQSIFFWNKTVRGLVGLGYVNLIIMLLPFLRRKLLAPFKEDLLADAKIDGFVQEHYFKETSVLLKNPNQKSLSQKRLIVDVIPQIKGQIILEGESGLGKSMFLRYMAKQSRQILVYLRADRCASGVIKAIQDKILGEKIKDALFLKSLVHNGTLDIYIDGLNEVNADTRAQICQFVENYSKGNIILTTQPLEWVPPVTAKTFVLQPLEYSQIEAFLIGRSAEYGGQPSLYEKTCQQYLKKALDPEQPEAILDPIKHVLSNPMDLTIIAQMLVNKKEPNLFALQEQQYQTMAEDYKRVNVGVTFPIKPFSERVYQMRINNETVLTEEEFPEELVCLERFKMLLGRKGLDHENNLTTKYHFRHDKIMEFFIAQTFLGSDNDRVSKHINDPVFRGVYLLLADLMEINDAQKLREEIIINAAEKNDNTISNKFILHLRSREKRESMQEGYHEA